MIDSLDIAEPFYLVADAYYACGKIAHGLLRSDQHLVTRARKNTVAYEVCVTPPGPRKRGRPKIYGKKLRLAALFDHAETHELWKTAKSPVYDDYDVEIIYER